MGVRILTDNSGSRSQAVLYSSTTDWAFGPVFYEEGEHDAEERAQAFLRWLVRDPRPLTDAELAAAYTDWRKQEADQWAREDAAQWPEEDDDEATERECDCGIGTHVPLAVHAASCRWAARQARTASVIKAEDGDDQR